MKKAKALTTRSLVSDKLITTMKELAKTAGTNMLLKVRSPIIVRRTATSSRRAAHNSAHIKLALVVAIALPWLPAVGTKGIRGILAHGHSLCLGPLGIKPTRSVEDIAKGPAILIVNKINP